MSALLFFQSLLIRYQEIRNVYFRVTILRGFINSTISTSGAKNGVVGVFSTMFSIHKTFFILAQFQFQ